MRATAVLKIGLPIIVLLVAAWIAAVMIQNRPVAEKRQVQEVVPAVRVLQVHLQPVRLRIESYGTVRPRTQTTLVAEVPGKLTWISPSLQPGEFFDEGELLLKLDATEYELAVVQARAQIAQAKLRLQREQEEAQMAREEWNQLGEGEPPPLLLRIPQIEEAKAALAAAEAALKQAELNLKRTRVFAPYAGRVRSKLVEVGQFVTVGTPIAQVYAVDYVEVPLPISLEDLAYVDLPIRHRNSTNGSLPQPAVLLRARIAGREYTWQGRIVRTDGELDPKTRMLHVIAQVEDPYGRRAGSQKPPLAVGMFVNAEILGKVIPKAAILPRDAIRSDDLVYVIDETGRLHFRQVRVLRIQRDQVIVAEGLEEGDLVCLSPLETAVNNMRVEIAEVVNEADVAGGKTQR